MSNVMGAPAPAPAPTAAAPTGLDILPQVGQPGGWKAWVSQPENRAALVQAGIAMLQPLGVGQTTAGQIGGAIGAGMEARDRVVTGQQEAEQQALQNQIAQQEADARTTAAEASLMNAERVKGDLTLHQQLMQDNREIARWTEWLKGRAYDQYTGEPLVDLQDPAVIQQLQAEFNATIGAAPRSGGVPPMVPGGAAPPSLAGAIPGGAAAPAPGGELPVFATPEDVRAAISAGTIRSGQQFKTPDGRTKVVP